MKQNFIVTFKEIKVGGQPRKIPIYAPDHARATEWGIVQLNQWGMKNSPFELSEIVVPPPATKEEAKGTAKAEPKSKKESSKRKVAPK